MGTLTYTAGGLRKVFLYLLSADVVITLIEKTEMKILPVVLKLHHASDKEIAIIVSSIAALIQFIVTPILSYHSDRHRSRWGRRIPFIFWSTPLASLAIMATPFAPEFARALLGIENLRGWLESMPFSPVILCFGVLAVGFRFGHAILSTIYFSLFRDVVPSSHMGRFLALFRIVGSLATFATTYWLLGLAETHPREIFIGVGLFNFCGFFALCLFVREGDYPKVLEKREAHDPRSRISRTWTACRNFVAESYTQPVYWWTYVTRLFVYAGVPVSSFLIFFPQRELGLSFDQAGKLLSWPSIAWLIVAYPVGRLVDRHGAVTMLRYGLALTALAYFASFVLVVGPLTFLLSSLVAGVGFWIVMLTQLALAQEIFHRERYAQLSSAGILVQSLAIALVVSPVAGWVLDLLQGLRTLVAIPGIGNVTIGPYRFVNVMLGIIYGLAWLSLLQVRRHWRRLGGGTPAGYTPPL